MSKKPIKADIPPDLRRRLSGLTIESDSDRELVARYLAPGCPTFQSTVDYLEALAHPDRMGRKFRVESTHSKTCQPTQAPE